MRIRRKRRVGHGAEKESDITETPDISDSLYLAMWNKLEPDDFDRNNETDLKLLEYLGWLNEPPN